ncbi:MAG: anthranilate phosphoribosyltransferase [Planctomycetes bacterium]|nr:anthranilate phosphoribosyltransferase [Planctomycetota bacterium]
MSPTRSSWFAQSIPLLIERNELPSALLAEALRAMTSGSVDESEAAAFLIALRMKGESANDISTAVQVLREKMGKLAHPSGPVLDTCGTGGDGSGTFNISTAVALVVAAAGCRVVKHGNRSVSSRSGSADVLLELGVPIEKGPEWAQSCLDRFGFAFCFAPTFHPVLANIGPLRRKLGVRTIFNWLGPLLNPAAAEYQLLGVGNPDFLDPLAGALCQLGIRQAFLVSGADGLDEVSLSTTTHVRHVRDGRILSKMWNPLDFGLKPATLEDLRADGPEASAAVIRAILGGQDGPPRRIVLANSAAALFAAEQVASLPDGVARAVQAIDSGAARELLDRLQQS